jgi:hypothetical protein
MKQDRYMTMTESPVPKGRDGQRRANMRQGSFGSKADIQPCLSDVRFVPKADITLLIDYRAKQRY